MQFKYLLFFLAILTTHSAFDQSARDKRRAERQSTKDPSKQQSSTSGKSHRSSDSKKTARIENGCYMLDDSNFESHVLNSNDLWFIFFLAPWCGHCKNMQHDWDLAAKELKGKVNFAIVDGTVSTKIASKFGVSSYPTLKFAPPFASYKNIQDYT